MEAVRTVITGMGVVSPFGCDLDQYWQAIVSGKSGVVPIDRFDVSEYTTRIAALVSGFEPDKYIEKKEGRRMDLCQQYAVVASQLAMDHSGIDTEKIDLLRAGVIIGSGIGGITTFEKQHEALLNGGPRKVSPFFIPMMIADMCAGLVAMRFGFRGPNYATVSACASSSHAVLDAFRSIQRGETDIMIACGAGSRPGPCSSR